MRDIKLENVSKIVVVFENCEDIDIPAKDIHRFGVTGITERIFFDNFQQEENRDILRWYEAKNVFLHMIYRPQYRRILEYKDITQIHMYDNSGNVEWFMPDWEGGDYSNALQKTRESGNYIITNIAREQIESE